MQFQMRQLEAHKDNAEMIKDSLLGTYVMEIVDKLMHRPMHFGVASEAKGLISRLPNDEMLAAILNPREMNDNSHWSECKEKRLMGKRQSVE